MHPLRANTVMFRSGPRAQPAAPGDLCAGAARRTPGRPEIDGKFFRIGGQRLYLCGVTYGPFAPSADGEPYDHARTREDFARMSGAGINTVRLYTPPPDWLLDAAADHGLYVMA